MKDLSMPWGHEFGVSGCVAWHGMLEANQAKRLLF